MLLKRTVLTLVLLLGGAHAIAEEPLQMAGGFTLPVIGNDKNYSFEPGAANAVTYVDFWASWCGPCKLSFPDMKQLQAEFASQGLNIVAISVDEKPEKAQRFIKRFEPNFTTLIDTTGSVAGQYKIPTMPTSFLIDRAGNIRAMHSGYRPGDIEGLRLAITELLNENP